jgi:hypothetical protein
VIFRPLLRARERRKKYHLPANERTNERTSGLFFPRLLNIVVVVIAVSATPFPESINFQKSIDRLTDRLHALPLKQTQPSILSQHNFAVPEEELATATREFMSERHPNYFCIANTMFNK